MTKDDLLYKAVVAISSRCDGARAHDHQGFNGRDASFGNSIATRPPEMWTPRMQAAAHRMLRIYKKQLAKAGIDYAAIPLPVASVAVAANMVTQEADMLLVRFPYSAAMVASIKTVNNFRWDPSRKAWTVPAKALSEQGASWLERNKFEGV